MSGARFKILPGWRQVLAEMAIEPSHLAALAGLPTDIFERTQGTLNTIQYLEIWKQLERLTGPDELPLRIGQAVSLERFDPQVFAAFCSDNLNQALLRMADFVRLIGPFRLEVEIGAQATVATHRTHGLSHRLPAAIGLSKLVFLTRLARLALKRDVIPFRVELRELPASIGLYQQFFGVTPVRGAHNRIAFDAETARLPFESRTLPMWSFFEQNAPAHALSAANETTATRVRDELMALLPSGRATLDEVAVRLKTSRRTLQRRLAAEGLSFQKLLAEMRLELARHYLLRSRLNLDEIRFLLGFQDTNSFIRAFSQWTGRPPASYRKAG